MVKFKKKTSRLYGLLLDLKVNMNNEYPFYLADYEF